MRSGTWPSSHWRGRTVVVVVVVVIVVEESSQPGLCLVHDDDVKMGDRSKACHISAEPRLTYG